MSYLRTTLTAVGTCNRLAIILVTVLEAILTALAVRATSLLALQLYAQLGALPTKRIFLLVWDEMWPVLRVVLNHTAALAATINIDGVLQITCLQQVRQLVLLSACDGLGHRGQREQLLDHCTQRSSRRGGKLCVVFVLVFICATE